MRRVIKQQNIQSIHNTSRSSRDLYSLSNLNFEVRIFVQGHCVVIVNLQLYRYFELDTEQEVMHNPLSNKQETA